MTDNQTLIEKINKLLNELKGNQKELKHLITKTDEIRTVKKKEKEIMEKLRHKINKFPPLPPEPEWMKQLWAHDHKILTKYIKFLKRYPKWEIFKWFLKKVWGPFKGNKRKEEFIPNNKILNNITPIYKIGFVGDIMVMRYFNLEFDQSIKDFFSDVDLIVGNFEGTLTLQPSFILSQRHNNEIIEQLTIGMDTPAEKWLLCVSNNHSGDFGFADYNLSLDRLRWAGFNVFGRKDVPNFIFAKEDDESTNFILNFVSGTMWKNHYGCDYQTQLDERDEYYIENDGNVFNILYPHWNYEYELYPRRHIVDDYKPLIKKWDLIFGTHPHVPQPITEVNVNGTSKILAYSGGNFTSGYKLKYHGYGLIMKCEIGPLKSNAKQLAVGNLEWRFCWSEHIPFEKKVKFKKYMEKPENPPTMRVKIVPNCKYFKKLNKENEESLL